jgi:uncharacterized protein YecE (DUF72 family)
MHDLVAHHPCKLTTGWAYMRFHGPSEERKYAGCYPHQALTAAARRIRRWLDSGCDVYVYFNNDEKGNATENALDLLRFVNR